MTLLTVMVSCKGSVDEGDSYDEVYEPIELNNRSRATAENLEEFYTVLTRDVAEYVDTQEGDKNFVISPLSASMVLAMMGNAVEGELRDEIITYLGLEDLEGMNELAAVLLEKLPAMDKKTRLTLANSVWANDEYTLEDSFVKDMEGYYRSEINYFDAGNPGVSASRINGWCSSNTGGRIKDYIDAEMISPYLLTILLNAMDFKSRWRTLELFQTYNTTERAFHGLSGETMVKTMVSRSSPTVCYMDEELTYIRLLFGNAAFGLEIIMPSRGEDIVALPGVLERELSEIRGNSQIFSSVIVTLPRFKTSTKLELNDALKRGGLSHLDMANLLTLFTDKTSGLITFRQKAMFEVDEDGARAVAVSSGEGKVMAPMPSEPIEINIDRPFMFFITESSTGACVVSGRITDL